MVPQDGPLRARWKSLRRSHRSSRSALHRRHVNALWIPCARVAIARANREANIKYINKQALKDENTSSDIKKEKEDVAVTEPQTEPDCPASQRGCQDEGSGPSSSGSIPIRELVPHHVEHGLQGVPGSVGALTRQEARALQQGQAHQGEDPRAEG